MSRTSDTVDRSLGRSLQDLVVSGIRLSTGLTLYGIGQAQKVLEASTGSRGVRGAAEALGAAFDGLTEAVESNLDEKARETLRSVTRSSAEAIDKAFDSLCPSALRDAGDRLFGSRRASSEGSAPAASLAVDVLSGPAAT